MQWEAILSLLALIIKEYIVPLSVLVLLWQVWQLRIATNAQAFATALHYLQDETVRSARRVLFSLTEKTLDGWTEDEKKEVERVCQSYDLIALMVRHRMISRRILVGGWRDSIIRSWRAAKPLIDKYRTDRAAPRFWTNFEWLSKLAEKGRW